MAFAVSRTLRLASIAICAIVALSFLLFAVNQTSTASGHQQEVINEHVAKPKSAKTHESGFRKGLDEVADELTSPVSGVSSSEWGSRGVRLLFALLVYGFGLGYIARMLRVRT